MKLSVYVTLPDASQVLAGTLDFGDVFPGVDYATTFTYSKSWLSHSAYFPLDPGSLNPATNPSKDNACFKSPHSLTRPLQVFHDSLPDDWGHRLLVRQRKLIGVRQQPPYLLREIGENSLGALSFFEPKVKPISKSTHAERVIDLNDLIDAAERFETGDENLDPEMERLFAAGSTPGGARPKVLAQSDNTHWIAKFPSKNKDNNLDVVGLEGACMRLALNAGLNVAAVRIELFPKGNVLLVERFDVTKQNGRNHMISLRTLCNERPGAVVLTYKEVMEEIKKRSVHPQDDVAMFFRQMTFNAVIGNTDDHLKNFAMIHDSEGYKLSKAFDLVPDVQDNKHHTLFFNMNGFTSGPELVDIGKSWEVKDAQQIVVEVCDAAMAFSSIAQLLKVEPGSIDKIAPGIEKRSCEYLTGISARTSKRRSVPA
ncbi:MAG: type II toxin-antitoxin system HipA family toxin [Rhodocyclaceae bacterium]|nr:MAG: type II toxin-antitoxin system HipA family toxin [Rhodocyclaceae bacterium]